MSSYDQDNPPPQQGGSRKGRLFIALLIALFALISYWSQTQVNPVTGEKQHLTITPDQEIRLGLESAPEMSREMGGELPSSDPRTQIVQKMGQKLVQGTEALKSPWEFKFHLLADPQTVNAFALPGGQVFITLGLFNQLQTEAQLAGVLGHEMGHVIERHSAQQMAKSQFGNLLVVAVGTAASSGEQTGRGGAMAIAAFVNQMLQLRYSRGDESEADKWGVHLMEEVGYTPVAMIEVMDILKNASGKGREGVPEMFQTHPNPDLRSQQIKEILEKNPPKPGLTEGRNLHSLYSGEQIQNTSDDNGNDLERLLENLFHVQPDAR